MTVQQPWPRTATERLLVSMCQGSAAQALALLEALTDTNRRTLLSSAPSAADTADTELLDVYAELFMAAQEIISGQFFSFAHFWPPCIAKAALLIPSLSLIHI